jgi:hypothetical protein
VLDPPGAGPDDGDTYGEPTESEEDYT